MYLYTRIAATAQLFQVITNTHTKSVQKQIKSKYHEEYSTLLKWEVNKKPYEVNPVLCRINHLLISRSHLQASETERHCKSVLVYGKPLQKCQLLSCNLPVAHGWLLSRDSTISKTLLSHGIKFFLEKICCSRNVDYLSPRFTLP